MTSAPDPASVLGELERHPAREALVGRVRAVALRAAARREIALLSELAPSDAPELTPEQATTSLGNVLEALGRAAPTASEATLLSVLLALGIAPDFPSAPETEAERAKELCFLGAESALSVPLVADAVLGEERLRPFWRAVAALAEPSGAGPRDRALSLCALSSLAASTSAEGRQAASALAARTSDPLAAALLRRPSTERVTRLSGELHPAPPGPVALVLLAATGVLFLARGARIIGRFGLAWKQPAELELSERGLELAHRTELLGRVLRAKDTLIPLGNLAKVTREIRYPRLGLYLGLCALAVGSYLGMGLLVDGARVPGGSLPLLGMGLLLLALGLALDYGLTVLTDNVRGRCRIVIVPKKGKKLCIGALDPARADAMLTALGSHAKSA